MRWKDPYCRGVFSYYKVSNSVFGGKKGKGKNGNVRQPIFGVPFSRIYFCAEMSVFSFSPFPPFSFLTWNSILLKWSAFFDRQECLSYNDDSASHAVNPTGKN
jgi:hypothetical protein